MGIFSSYINNKNGMENLQSILIVSIGLFMYEFLLFYLNLIPTVKKRLRQFIGKLQYNSDNATLVLLKPLLNNNIYQQFTDALRERSSRGHFAEITFIGVNKAEIKEHKKLGNILNVTVNFIGEVITCVRDKDNKIVSGDPEKIKKIYDTWVFSRDTTSQNPNWQLVNILT